MNSSASDVSERGSEAMRVLDPVLQQRAVRQAGQGVVQPLVGQHLGRLLALAQRGQPAGAAQGGDGQREERHDGDREGANTAQAARRVLPLTEAYSALSGTLKTTCQRVSGTPSEV